MDDESQPQGETGSGGAAGERVDSPRSTSLAAVAGVVILIGLGAFALYRRSRLEPPPDAPAAAPAATTPPAGTPITAIVPFKLSPEASVLAERYRCICNCNLALNVCTCSKTPGSNDIKAYLQERVNEKKTAAEIDQEMVAKYGEQVLMSNPVPGATPVKGAPPAAAKH
ncbi:MAG TPA: cytochrome c-type biogenesis protein CcmH [Candidatus Polarisedimenticolia bacterium]|nr:cytochrome c-type biogenesis protein CcmH [Candidatus Polarisedimenticolia bacterium]